MIIRQWAVKHGVSLQAVLELEHMLRIGPTTALIPEITVSASVGKSEAWAQDAVVIEGARLAVRLFRNNSGAFKDENGQMVRFGLGNTSARVNKVLKSPDLVGWRPRTITAADVGSVIGQCTMREMKAPGWTYSASDHERAQLAFLELAIADGCDASFATGPGTL